MITAGVRETAMGRLMAVMGLAGCPVELEAVCKTADGMYLGQVAGDLGYNAFIGRPAAPHVGPGLDLVQRVWQGYSRDEQARVVALARLMPDGSRLASRGSSASRQRSCSRWSQQSRTSATIA